MKFVFKKKSIIYPILVSFSIFKMFIFALFGTMQTGDLSVVYGVVSTLVNLCNAYDKQEIIPEMLELAKFAKRHIPEQHELDDPDFVTKRVDVSIF